MEINGSSAIITGGASGLGEATARKLATLGVRVTVFDRNEERAKEVVAEIGGSTNYGAGDVTDPDDCQTAVDQAAEGGNLRIAVNCAGTGWVGRVINRDGSPHDLAPFKFIQDLNVIGTFNVMTKAASAMGSVEPQANGERGVIVNTASVAAFDGQIGQLAYSASKGAVVGVSHIAGHVVGGAADLGDDLLGPLLVPVEHGDPHPFGCELAGGGLTEARGTSGDDC